MFFKSEHSSFFILIAVVVEECNHSNISVFPVLSFSISSEIAV